MQWLPGGASANKSECTSRRKSLQSCRCRSGRRSRATIRLPSWLSFPVFSWEEKRREKPLARRRLHAPRCYLPSHRLQCLPDSAVISVFCSETPVILQCFWCASLFPAKFGGKRSGEDHYDGWHKPDIWCKHLMGIGSNDGNEETLEWPNVGKCCEKCFVEALLCFPSILVNFPGTFGLRKQHVNLLGLRR